MWGLEFDPCFTGGRAGTVGTLEVAVSPRPDKTSGHGRYLHAARGASGPLRGTNVQANVAGCLRYSTSRASSPSRACDPVTVQNLRRLPKARYSTISFLRLWTNATTSRSSGSGTLNFAKVAA